jgi:YbgC/YbaW family acyl-CoA thioester hydrolase
MDNYLQSFYTVRFSDCDPFRHLNNARYIDYFLNAREDHLKDHYNMDLAEFYRKGLGWVILNHEIIYLRPASFNEKICIKTALLDAGPEHLQLEALMLDEKQRQLKSIMHTRFIPINLATGKKEPHAADFMEFLGDKVIPGFDGKIPPVSQRAEYWQEQLKGVQRVG